MTTVSPVTQPQESVFPEFFLKHAGPVDPLWSIMLKIFQILNVSQPELTTSYWLFYNTRHPSYESIRLVVGYNVSKRDTVYVWSQEVPALVLQTISGQGTRLGKVPLSHSK